MTLYWAANGPMPTTAAFSPVTTGTSLKTMLQIATPSTRGIKVVEWGISFSGFADAARIKCELIDTNGAATVTAHVAAGVQPYNDPSAPASLMTLGTTATGYTSSGEGSITSTRYGDAQQVSPADKWWRQWPLGREFAVGPSRFLRVRVHAPAAVDAYTYVVWEE
ncbi:hypothetical protein [Streptosporangium sp. NPDC049078]|uniref:hypothetical protein n=1 Tax=Streptosporangium sp. NPDC049078 TaxID=3155767 RepID=UPI003446ADA0